MSTSARTLRILVKTERADEHFRNLYDSLKAFYQTEPYQVVTEDDAQTGDRVFRVRVIRDVPPEIVAAIGDIIHNLRSALDHLAYQLVLANGSKPTTQTCYPVFDSIEKYKAHSAGKVKGMSGAAIKLIDATEPYKGGNDNLWRLHQLDIIDKHRLLPAAGGLCPAIALDFTALLHSQHPDSSDVVLPTICLPTQNQSIVKDGAEIHRIPRFAEHPDMHTQPQFPPAIAICEPTIGEAEPIFQMLKKFFHLVDGIVQRFGPLL